MSTLALSQLGRRTTEPPISWLMSTALARPQLISLAAGFTDSESLPVDEAREILQDVLGSARNGRAALQYGTTVGDGGLRRLTGEHLHRQDGAAVPAALYAPERLCITSGSQQLLYILTECLCSPGDLVLLEDPTYFVYLGIVQSHGLDCRGIPLAADGIDLAHLERTLDSLKRSGAIRRLRLLYLVTYFQNPTGVSAVWAKKAAALELLRRYEKSAGHPIYLVEDAAYRELRFAGDDVPSLLAARRAADRVIYAGTFSKPFATGVRVGWGVLPASLLEVVLRVKANHDFGTSNLLQQLMKRALVSGAYDRHVLALRERYAHKAAVMVKAMRRHFPAGAAWDEPRGGLYVWARLPRSIKSGTRSRLFRAALRHDVLYVPGALCYGPDPTRPRPDHELRMSFGGASVPDIRTGIARLGATLRELSALG
jgi:2-aminoadipate transaminase